MGTEVFKHIVDAVGEAILTIDDAGAVVMCNRAARRVWGCTDGELVGKTARDLFTRESAGVYDEAVDQQLQAGPQKDAWFELTGQRLDGKTFPAEVRLSSLEHSSAAYTGRKMCIAAVRDLTARKRREAQLQESEQAFRTLLDSIFEGIFIHDDGVLLEANQQAAELTGYPKDELRGMRMALLTTDSLAGPGEPETHDVGEFADVIEAVGVNKNGETADIEILTKRITYRGQPVWVSAFRDVTAFKEKERELRRRLEAEDLISHISSRFINANVSEMDDTISDCLARIGEMTGVDRAYMVAMAGDRVDDKYKHEWTAPGIAPALYEYQRKGPDDFAWFKARLEEGRPTAIHDVEALPPEAANEREMLASLGIKSGLFTPMKANNQLVGFVGFDSIKRKRVWSEETVNQLKLVGDILANAVERQRQQLALEEANEALERKVVQRTQALAEKHAQLVQSEKMAALGQLVAGVAHEINTPLGAIKSNNDILDRSLTKLGRILLGEDAPAEIREHRMVNKLLGGVTKLSGINEEAIERIVRIVSSLRKFARLDSAEVDTVNLHAGLDNTLTLVHHELKNRIEVSKEYGDIPAVECYPNQLNQVFMNLLVNASQAIEGKGKISIRTRRAPDESVESVVVEITDSGKGIPKDNLKRIFDPGFTTKGVGVGTGLGLSIVHQLIRDHSGRIEVDSEPGQGTTFRLILPTALQQRPASSLHPPQRASA